jgi:hypothetical protein
MKGWPNYTIRLVSKRLRRKRFGRRVRGMHFGVDSEGHPMFFDAERVVMSPSINVRGEWESPMGQLFPVKYGARIATDLGRIVSPAIVVIQPEPWDFLRGRFGGAPTALVMAETLERRIWSGSSPRCPAMSPASSVSAAARRGTRPNGCIGARS